MSKKMMSRDMILIRSYCQDEVIFLQEYIIKEQKLCIENPDRGDSSYILNTQNRIEAYKRVIRFIDSVNYKNHNTD